MVGKGIFVFSKKKRGRESELKRNTKMEKNPKIPKLVPLLLLLSLTSARPVDRHGPPHAVRLALQAQRRECRGEVVLVGVAPDDFFESFFSVFEKGEFFFSLSRNLPLSKKKNFSTHHLFSPRSSSNPFTQCAAKLASIASSAPKASAAFLFSVHHCDDLRQFSFLKP